VRVPAPAAPQRHIVALGDGLPGDHIEAVMEEWKRHLAHSKRVQRGLLWILAAGALLAIVTWSFAVAGLVAIVVGAGFWITQAHISEFEAKLKASRVTPAVGRPAVRSRG
jgi:hypothetical protein